MNSSMVTRRMEPTPEPTYLKASTIGLLHGKVASVDAVINFVLLPGSQFLCYSLITV